MPHTDDEGEFEVVEELGFYTEVGLLSTRAESKNRNAYLNHSIGYHIQRIKGHFVTPSALSPVLGTWKLRTHSAIL